MIDVEQAFAEADGELAELCRQAMLQLIELNTSMGRDRRPAAPTADRSSYS